MTAWNDFALMMARGDLHRDAAIVAALVMRGESAEADAYAVEHRVAERLAAFKAAGGVL